MPAVRDFYRIIILIQMGHVKRKSAFEHAQNVRIYIIVRMRMRMV